MTSSVAPLTSNRGQALLELILTAAFAFVLVTEGLQWTYFAWSKMWIRHILYEGLICNMEEARDCRQKAQSALDTFVPIRNRQPEISFRHRNSEYSGKIRVQITNSVWVGEGTTLRRTHGSGGFVYLTFLLPLAALIFCCLSLVALTLNLRAKHLQICRSKVLEANQLIEEGVQRILSLNSLVLFLQYERDALEAAARADPEPYTQAILQANIQRNQIQQMGITVQQKLIKQAALTKSRAIMASLHVQANSENALGVGSSPPRLLLTPVNTWHTAKVQKRALSFSKDHKITAHWVAPTQSINRIFGLATENLLISCASTIRQEGFLWMPMLTR